MATIRLRKLPRQEEPEISSLDREEIARLAYEFYQQRGCANGCDLDDWLKAEGILRQRDGRRHR